MTEEQHNHRAMNRANWDERTAIHLESRAYDVEGWIRDGKGPPPRELEALGDVSGLRLLHLQCHIGLDTLAWARAGASVTGLDFSPAAIAAATEITERAGLSGRARFVCADVYDACEALDHATFDVVYVSLGSLCWLPSRGPLGRTGWCPRGPGWPVLPPRRAPLGLGAGGRRTAHRAQLLRRGRTLRRGCGDDLHRCQPHSSEQPPLRVEPWHRRDHHRSRPTRAAHRVDCRTRLDHMAALPVARPEFRGNVDDPPGKVAGATHVQSSREQSDSPLRGDTSGPNSRDEAPARKWGIGRPLNVPWVGQPSRSVATTPPSKGKPSPGPSETDPRRTGR